MSFSVKITSPKTGYVFDVPVVKAIEDAHGTKDGNQRFHKKMIFSTLSTLPGELFSIKTKKTLGEKSIYRLRHKGDEQITYEDDNKVTFVIVVVCGDCGDEGDFISSIPSIVYKLSD